MNSLSGDTRGIQQVQAGMRVVDANGEVVGTVKDVLMGDPEAVTLEGQDDEGTAAVLSRGRDVPHVDRSRLLRTGYLVVRHRGLIPRRRFASADEIAEVRGDVVQLTVPAKRLAS